jgi:hypothetical protein
MRARPPCSGGNVSVGRNTTVGDTTDGGAHTGGEIRHGRLIAFADSQIDRIPHCQVF